MVGLAGGELSFVVSQADSCSAACDGLLGSDSETVEPEHGFFVLLSFEHTA